MQHSYLISFTFTDTHGTGSGHMDLTLPTPLRPNFIPHIVAKIRGAKPNAQISITNIYKFEQPEHVHRASCDGPIGEKVCGLP